MNNSNGFQTNVWGPPAWLFLHLVANNYDPDRHDEYKTFFISLKGVLPCKTCRENYHKNLLKFPLKKEVMLNREMFSRWLFDLHNQVNIDIGNELTYPQTNAGFKMSKKFYEQFRAKCSTNCQEPKKGTKRRYSTVVVKSFPKPKSKSSVVVK